MIDYYIHLRYPEMINMERENGPDWKTICLYDPVVSQVPY